MATYAALRTAAGVAAAAAATAPLAATAPYTPPFDAMHPEYFVYLGDSHARLLCEVCKRRTRSRTVKP